MKRAFFIYISLVCLALGPATAQNKKLIYKINIMEDIGSNSWIYLQNGLHEARQKGADCVLLHINTYGGGVKEADSMRTAILNFPLPVIAFIDNNAASAGALISIACDSIYMRRSGTIGAATVVSMDGAAAPDKYQSYMRAMIRATAESHHGDSIVESGDTFFVWKRDPKLAEAMVDERVVIPGMVDSTQVLTLTASEAIKVGYCEGIAENVDEIATRYLHYESYDIETYNPTTFDRVKGFLTNAFVQSILIMLIVGGIFFELNSPGVGFPTAIALTAAILYFTPLYLGGYAQSWEILIFVAGLILIVFELFVIPGFGIAGISGIVLIISSLLLALIGNIHFDFEGVPVPKFYRALLTVFAGLGLGSLVIIYFSSRIGKRGFLKNVALQADEEGYISVSTEPLALVGKTGIAATVLRPSGRIEVDDKYYDAVSLGAFIEKGEMVNIVKYENLQLYVAKLS